MRNVVSGGLSVEKNCQSILVKLFFSILKVAYRSKESRLGIFIEPSQVRLVTSIDDPYTWAALSEKKHLFSKNISNHSTGDYKELCQGVGFTFEVARMSKPSSGDALGGISSNDHFKFGHQTSFTAKIDELQAENRRLLQELSQLRASTCKYSESKRRVGEEVSELTGIDQNLEKKHRKMQRWQSILKINCLNIYKALT